MVVFENQVLHVEKRPGASPSIDPILHLLINGCARIRGENGKLSHIGIEPFGKADRLMNHPGRFMQAPQDIGGMDLKTILLKHLHGLNCARNINPFLQVFKGLRIE